MPKVTPGVLPTAPGLAPGNQPTIDFTGIYSTTERMAGSSDHLPPTMPDTGSGKRARYPASRSESPAPVQAMPRLSLPIQGFFPRGDSTVFSAVEVKGAKVRRSKGDKSNDEKTIGRRRLRFRANVAPGIFPNDKSNGTMVNGFASCAGYTAGIHPSKHDIGVARAPVNIQSGQSIPHGNRE